MSRRNRQHLHAVPDPDPSVTRRKGPNKRRSREPDPGPPPTDEFDLFYGLDDAPPLAAMGIAAEMAAMSRADNLPIDDMLDQLADLGMPPDLLEESRALGAEHQAELAGLLTAATAILTGDPVAGLLSVWQPLLDKKMTAFEAELVTAEILWTFDGASGDDDLVDGLARLIEAAEHTGRPEALVMCRMLTHLGPPEIRNLAVRAANTLAVGGVRDRPWVSRLGTAAFQRAYGCSDEQARVLAVQFAYGKRPHAFVFVVDEVLGSLDGLFATDDVDELYRQVRLEMPTHDQLPTEIGAAEAAELIRSALALPFCPEDEDDEAEMEGIVPVVLERLRHLPTAGSGADKGTAASADRDWPPPGVSVNDFGPHPRARAKVVHRIKVSIAGCKPPVWRRLEVPSDMNLQALHDVLRMSFRITEQHHSRFSIRGRTLAVDEAKHTTIGEIAPRKGSTFDYLYGDTRVHRIRVEHVGPGDPEAGYPRCLDGRQAGPAQRSDAGEDWDDQEDPERFDVDELNDRLDMYVRGKRRRSRPH